MADIVWKTVTLPQAIDGVPYEAGLAVTGDVTAITNCVVASGALPTGITIAADFVRLTGTPTSGAGTFTFTLTMTDTAGGVTSPSFSIQVVNADVDLDQDILLTPVKSQLHREWPTLY